jgi:hypothetical protein
MLARKADGPLMVLIPGPPQDRPSWRLVGGLAAAGFIVGIGWPRLMGVRPGPSLPEAPSASVSPPAPAASASAAPAPAAGSPVAVVATPSPITAVASPQTPGAATLAPLAPLSAPPSAAPSAPRVNVVSGPVLSCKTEDGDSLKGPDCGKLRGLDGVVAPRLRKLAECPEAAAAAGRLQLVVHLDFARGWVSADLGHTQTVASPEPLLACARADLAGATIGSVGHDNARYSVVYSVVFDAAGGAGASPEVATPPPSRPAGDAAEGTAQVVWEVALVRDAPKTGKVLVRLQRGTQVHVGAAKDGWYPVKYGDGNAGEGWVYRGAIGK